MFGSGESTTYECRECDARFEAMQDEHDAQECPECGAGGAAAVPRM